MSRPSSPSNIDTEECWEEDDMVGEIAFPSAIAGFPQPSFPSTPAQYAPYAPLPLPSSISDQSCTSSFFSPTIPQTAPINGTAPWTSQSSVGVPMTPMRGDSIDRGFGGDIQRDLAPIIKKASTKVKAVLRLGKGRAQPPNPPTVNPQAWYPPSNQGAAYQMPQPPPPLPPQRPPHPHRSRPLPPPVQTQWPAGPPWMPSGSSGGRAYPDNGGGYNAGWQP